MGQLLICGVKTSISRLSAYERGTCLIPGRIARGLAVVYGLPLDLLLDADDIDRLEVSGE